MTRDVKTFISITVVSLYRPSKTMDMHIVTVYDVGNKFIAYSGPVPEVSHVLSEWGSLFCLASDGKVKSMFLTHQSGFQCNANAVFFVIVW